MKTILIIIGIIALVWLGLLLFFNIALYIAFSFNKETKYIAITRETCITPIDYEGWYIIPTISFYFEFKNTSYPSVTFRWIKWEFYILYHLKTEEEEELEAEVRRQLNGQK